MLTHRSLCVMRVAFVKDAVYPWEIGGAQKRNWEIARRLADRHDVHLFGMHYWDGPRKIERDGVTLHGVCEPRDLYTDGRRSIPQALYFTRHVLTSLLKHDFDVIDCQKSSLFPFFPTKVHAIARNSALVGMWTEIWGDYWYEYLGKKGLAGKTIERVAVRLPDVNIAISEFIADQMREVGRIDGISVVHNGVDYERIRGIEAADTSWDVIYAGRLSEHKNVDVLVDAVAAASDALDKDIDCGIIGNGPERERLERFSRETGAENCVEFLGFLEEEDDVIANMKSASVFVLPSEREGFPNTILEANACGVPVITVDAFNNGGRAIVEDGETGYVTDLRSNAIADRIVEIVSDQVLRARLGDAAREYGAAHDWDVIVDQTEEVYLNAAR